MDNTNPAIQENTNGTECIDNGKPLQPLTNAVIEFIFQEKVSGDKVMHGLANAILKDSGDKPISTIISIQPQRYQYGSGGRWYRLDVLAKTEDNEIVLLEVQVEKQLNMNTRSMLYAMEPLQSRLRKGDKWDTIVFQMPRVISINLLEFELRKNGRNFHQVIEPVYREEPREVAEHHHITHNIELPKFRRIEPDLDNTLHLWLTAICRAQDEERTLREVVDMDTKLKNFEAEDQSFFQFIMNYDIANMDEETRRLHNREILEVALERENILMQMAEAREEGESMGISKGISKGITMTAKNMLLKGYTDAQVIDATGLSAEDLSKLRKEANLVSEQPPEYQQKPQA